MSEFITVERTHPDFLKYLTGEFSNELCALPMHSLNISRDNKKVTFQLLHKNEVVRPPMLKVLSQVLRLDLLTLTLTPAICIAYSYWSEANRWLTLLALLSLAFLHTAVFCRNDFVDHMHGIDSLNEKGGSRVLQRGWMRAASVKKLYLSLMAVAILFVLPVVLARPELLLVCFIAVAGVFGYSHLRWARSNWVLGDLSIWFCLGPLICFGIKWVINPVWSSNPLWIGAYFGLLALAYVEVRRTISIVIDDIASLSTMPTRLGFDRAKIFIIVLFMLAGLIAFWAGGAMTALVGLNFWLALKTFHVASPLSSILHELPKKIIWVHIVSGLLFLIQTYFQV